MKKILEFVNRIESGLGWTTTDFVIQNFDGNFEETYLLLIYLSKNELLFEENFNDNNLQGRKIWDVNEIVENFCDFIEDIKL